jgi:Mannosyl-glycoprotein endo-beta-N-acetylglucosaminidase
MKAHSFRILSLPVSLLVAFASFAGAVVINARVASANVTTHTPVMGPSLLNAGQLAAWYFRHSGVAPQIPAFGGHPAGDVAALAQVFIDDGNAEGVRGDMAFVQSQLETGWLGFQGSQIPPDAYNYAGVNAFDGRPGLESCAHGDSMPSRCMGTPQHGVLVQIQLLRSYADPSARTASGRFISAPSDRAGLAPLWEYFGGHNCPCGKLIWASADGYGLNIIEMYSQALAESGMAGACVPYAPPVAGRTSGTGYWEVTSDSVVHPVGGARFLGDTRGIALNAPLTGGESTSSANGYWLLGRDGGIFSYGDARFYGSTGGFRLNKPVNGMRRTRSNGGYWLVADDGGIFSFGNAHFFGSMGGSHLNQPVLGMERTPNGNGYWLFASDGGIFSYGDAQFYGSLGGTPLTSPVVSMQRTPTGNGYWMMTADGRIFPFGDARAYGDIAGCQNYGGAARLLVTPDGKGYWIATGNGAIIAFGDAKKLGFPSTIGGSPIALLGAN